MCVISSCLSFLITDFIGFTVPLLALLVFGTQKVCRHNLQKLASILTHDSPGLALCLDIMEQAVSPKDRQHRTARACWPMTHTSQTLLCYYIYGLEIPLRSRPSQVLWLGSVNPCFVTCWYLGWHSYKSTRLDTYSYLFIVLYYNHGTITHL